MAPHRRAAQKGSVMKRTFTVFLSLTLTLPLSLALIGCNPGQDEVANAPAENAPVVETTGNVGDPVVVNENAADRTGDATTDTAEQIGNAAENTAEAVSNAGVTAKIKNALLLSPITQGLINDINVDTTDTQVILKGHVHTQQEAQEAERLAKSVAPNRTIVNQLMVTTH